MAERNNITYEIKEHLGVIAKYDTGWAKELNLISWNGATPKYDIRDWDADHERMGRGITLRPAEMRKVIDIYTGANNRKVVEAARRETAEREERVASSGNNRPGYQYRSEEESADIISEDIVSADGGIIDEISTASETDSFDAFEGETAEAVEVGGETEVMEAVEEIRAMG